MSWIPIEWTRPVTPDQTELATFGIPARLRMAGAALRVAFIACMLVVTLRVSMPQNETIWTAYDTPGDLVRMLLGFAVCIWLVSELFRAPKDAQGYRTWLYFGLVAVPFAFMCLIVIW